MNSFCCRATFAFVLFLSPAAFAQEAPEPVDDTQHMDHSGHDMDSGEMDHSEHMMDSDEMDHSEHMDHSDHDMDSGEMDHSEHMMDSDHTDHSCHDMDSGQMDHSEHMMEPAQMNSGVETEELRDPHAYAEGEDFGPLGRPRLGDEKNFGAVLIERLEAVDTDDNSWAAFDGQVWYGRTYDRVNLQLEGEVDSGEIHELRTELLWSHAITPFWDTQLGLRHDSGEDPNRYWMAFGVQGLAQYWFHVEAMLYAGERGKTAARFEAEYDMLFTQRLILQPRIEMNLYGQNDEIRETGSGLSNLSAGLRLRYEFNRHFGPYLGIEWAGLYGGTADFARAERSSTEETRYLLGVHMWF
jgi:copper resistance protein B